MIVPKPIVGSIARGTTNLVFRPATSRRLKVHDRVFVKASTSAPVACHVWIRDVELVRLGDTSFAQARAAGYRTTEEFKAQWVWQHERDWATLRVEAKEEGFEVPRFNSRWAQKDAWAITIELDQSHVPRYLAAQSDELYVTNVAQALADEPEAVSEAEQEKITTEARQALEERQAHERKTRDADRALLAFEVRLGDVRRRSQLHGVSVSRELWMVQRAIQQRRSPAAILHMLEAAEEKLVRRHAA